MVTVSGGGSSSVSRQKSQEPQPQYSGLTTSASSKNSPINSALAPFSAVNALGMSTWSGAGSGPISSFSFRSISCFLTLRNWDFRCWLRE